MYERHPLSAAFPEMSAEEQDALTDDIEQHGQRDPITIYDGQVLDGWHRYQACSMLEIPCLEKELGEDVDPISFVISMNMHRRHLSATQRAAAVVMCSDWAAVGRPKKESCNVARLPKQTTTQEMAKIADVSPRTIADTKSAVKAGMGEDLRDGKISANKAAEMAKPKPATPPATTTDTEPPQPETVTIPKHEYEELHAVLEEYKAESEATEAVFDADDKVAAAVVEIRKLTAKIALVETQKTGLLNQCNELKRSSISKDRQIAKLEKELNKYKLEEVEK